MEPITAFEVFVSSLANTVGIVALLSLVPIIFYADNNPKPNIQGFLRWVGLYRCQISGRKEVIPILLLASLVAFAISSAVIVLGLSGRHTVESQDFDVAALLIFLLFHGLRTGIGEEVLFRGFIAKKLIHRLGFLKGNLLQALAFSLAHYPFMGPNFTAADRGVKLVVAFLLGYVFGYAMDRKCEGSIVPAIIAHGLYNIFASVLSGVVYYLVL